MPALPAPLSSGIECFCTDRVGARVEFGQTICLMVDGRAYLARCEMSLNLPARRDTGTDCVGAGLGPGMRQIPALHYMGLENRVPESMVPESMAPVTMVPGGA